MTATTRLLDDPAARVRRWRRRFGNDDIAVSRIADCVVSVLRQHPDLDLERFELTADEQQAVLDLAAAEADQKLKTLQREREDRDPAIRAAREKRAAERVAEMQAEISASKARYNRERGLWGLEFDHCRYLGGLRGPWRLVYCAAPTEEFWAAWRANKQMVRDLGYHPARTGRRWVVERTVHLRGPGVTRWGDWCDIAGNNDVEPSSS